MTDDTDIQKYKGTNPRKRRKLPTLTLPASLRDINRAVHLQKVASDFLLSFLEDHSDTKATELVEKWMSVEIQQQVAGMFKYHGRERIVIKRAEPKKPRSAYVMYSLVKREKLKKKYPDLPSTEITKKIREKWERFSLGKKRKYERRAEKDKSRYENEMWEKIENKKWNSGSK